MHLKKANVAGNLLVLPASRQANPKYETSSASVPGKQEKICRPFVGCADKHLHKGRPVRQTHLCPALAAEQQRVLTCIRNF